MPTRRSAPRSTAGGRGRWTRGASHHPDVGLGELPLMPTGGRRERRRRGGPHTPRLLVPLIAVAAGVGVAYVSQTAHGTQATYQATSLTVERDALRHEDARLADELGRLRSTERVMAAAQGLGMQPAGQWVFVATAPAPVIPAPQRLTAQSTSTGGALGRLTAELRGIFSSREGRSTGP